MQYRAVCILGPLLSFAVILLVLIPCSNAQDFRQKKNIHVPIGSINSLDALKTFVEDNGSFSPGLMSFGVHPAFRDRDTGKNHVPIRDDGTLKQSLVDGCLIPRVEWTVDGIEIVGDLCQIECRVQDSLLEKINVEYKPAVLQNSVCVVAWRLTVTNVSDVDRKISFTPRITDQGPAGGSSQTQKYRYPIGEETRRRDEYFTYDLDVLKPGESETLRFVFPVHAGEFLRPHKWVEYQGQNAMVDANVPVKSLDDPISVDMIFVPDPGPDFFQNLDVERLFVQAKQYWRENSGSMVVQTPDKRWNQGFVIMLAHAGMCMNNGAADVAVVNYNVFNRDGMYIANMMQKAGLAHWGKTVIAYFVEHPFNGRPYPEADNPGQVIWCMEQQWLLTQDVEWLKEIYPAARQLADMIVYYRTTKGPHWVNCDSLLFGNQLPEEKRQELKPGSCDGYNPQYTEAFDLAALRGAVGMALALKDDADIHNVQNDIRVWSDTAKRLATDYDQKYGEKLPDGYGSYAVLWPCRLYAYDDPKIVTQFGGIGAIDLVLWRYFAPAKAHQSLLAGNREAGWKTIQLHLDHPQMRDWFAFDEGGLSGSGGWQYLDTNWLHDKKAPGINGARAMPHGWAIAEVWLLMRDSLFFETEDELVLLAGIPEEWFRDPKGITVENAPTAFGVFSFTLQSGMLSIQGKEKPPKGFQLRTPNGVELAVMFNGKPLE